MRKEKVKEFFQLFFIILAFIAFMAIVGTAGASDLGNVTVEQIKVRLLIFLGIFIGSTLIAKRLMKGEEDEH